MNHLPFRSSRIATQEQRSAERYRLALWGTLTSVGSRGLTLLLLVLGVRLTVGYLGNTRFGLWATLSSMVAMLSLLDLGVGNALVNRVARAAAADEQRELRRVVSGGAALLAVLGVASAVLLAGLAWVLPWGPLFKLPDAALAAEARTAMFVFAILFGINLWSSGLLRILAGQQRLFEANLLSCGAAGLACLTLWWASSVQAGVPWLLAATFGVQTLAGLAAGVLLSRRRQLVLAEASAALSAERPHLLGTGALFLLLQVGTMLGWGSDTVLLALLRGSGEVAAFAVAMRLFQFASQPFAMLNAPLWASYADAQARGDARFVRLTLKRSFLVSLVGASVLCVGLWIAGPKVIAVWTQGAITIAPPVLALFAAWTILEVAGNAFGAYLNGCGIVREQVAVMLLFCLLVLPLKVWLGSTYGSAGLLVAAITAYLIVIVGLYGFVFRSRVLAPVGVEP